MVCKICGTDNNASAKSCSFCGNALNPVATPKCAPTPAPAPAPAPAPTPAPSVINNTVKQKTAALLVNVFEFLKLFMKQPVTAMQNYSIKAGEALFFAILQPISLFLLLLITSSQIKDKLQLYFGIFASYAVNSYLSFLSDEIGIFFKTFIFCIGSLMIFLIISIILGKFIFKGNLDLNKLFSFTVISQIPLTLSFILSMALVFFSIQSIVLAFMFGVISSIVIGTFAFAASFNISYDKCVYCSVFAYLAQSVVLYTFVIKIIQ